MKVSLYTTSYNGLFFKGGPVSLKDCISKAAEFGFDGVEFEGKRPHASPLDLDADDRKELKDLVASKGLEMPTISAYNNFVSPVMIQRENELMGLREVVKLASDMDVKIVRIFAAWSGWTRIDGYGSYDMARKYDNCDASRLQQWNWCKECIKEAAKFSGDLGVTLAFQNHVPLINSYQDCLDMINEVDSDYVKACLDIPCLNCQDDDWVEAAIRATGDLEVHTHFGGEYKINSEGKAVAVEMRTLVAPAVRYMAGGPRNVFTNYEVGIKTLKEIGYQGHVAYELCHPFMPKNHELVTVAEVDENVKAALAYMRSLI